jgi:glycerol-3-phosphate dehydrogenase
VKKSSGEWKNTIKMATDKTYLVENRMVDGRPCIVIPISDHVNINGITVKPINVDSKGDPGEDK